MCDLLNITVNPENFANSIKTHICDVEIRDKGVLYLYEDFIFTKIRICEVRENKLLAKISEFTVIYFSSF